MIALLCITWSSGFVHRKGDLHQEVGALNVENFGCSVQHLPIIFIFD